MKIYPILLLSLVLSSVLSAQKKDAKIIEVQEAWAANSINTTIFRKNSLTSYRDTQFIAYYNQQGFVMLGKRQTGTTQWTLKQTLFRGDVKDAHNSISIITDGNGYLHMTWGHHNIPLNYCKSIAPGSLELTGKLQMTGLHEQKLTYPEFHRLPDGNLLFLFRNGVSGQGNLVINSYSVASGKWTQLHENLIDGEGERNAYWQSCVDSRGTVHLSWVWRETPDVASNHDICYAKSEDGGLTWQKTTGEKYVLPINASTAEYACRIPQNSSLINQTSMSADENGNPYIATYWTDNDSSFAQYHLVYPSSGLWKVDNLAFRKTGFVLGGTGTRRIPISRPQVILWNDKIALIFRDEERGNKVSMAIKSRSDKTGWKIQDLYNDNLGFWEPTYDIQFWQEKKILNLFVQKVFQADQEGITKEGPQMVKVLEWKPK